MSIKPSPQTVTHLGMSPERKDAYEKVRGVAQFNRDYNPPGTLAGHLVTSPHAHARIKSIDTSEALRAEGVQAVLVGDESSPLMGAWLDDRPGLATGKVRFFGEPVAVVVANTESEAAKAAKKVKVEYEVLPVINTVKEALEPNAPLIHENLASYSRVRPFVYPQEGTNICHHSKIRKGDTEKAWTLSDVVVEGDYSIPQSDHAALETRSCVAEARPGGEIILHAASQAPYVARRMLSKHFGVDQQKIVIHTPLVGGSFGGKCAVHLEPIAILASMAAGGRPVKITCSRWQDITSSPVRIGLDAKVKLGASKDGTIQGAQITYHVNVGAYSDMGAVMTKSIAADCTGPYKIDNLTCDSYGVYTNRPYVTSFRGFGHAEYTFCIERTMDKLAFALGMDPAELRYKNFIKDKDRSPANILVSTSLLGDPAGCLTKVKELIGWNGGNRTKLPDGKVRAKGISCFWKAPSTATSARSGAIITFNPDGTVNLNLGSVEMGQGSKSGLAQLLAHSLGVDISNVRVNMEVDTSLSPVHWKTVASATTFLEGRSVLAAVQDAITQIKNTAAGILRCQPMDLEVGGGRVFVKGDPQIHLDLSALVQAYQYPDGNAVGGQVVGHGSYSVRHLTPLDQETGKGRSGPAWTVGAQAAEVEFDPSDCSYKVTKLASVMDAGKLINPALAKGVVMGGMSMGLGLGTREELLHDESGKTQNANFRQYRLLRMSEAPQYLVDFVETPLEDGPLGARGFGEHGIIGIPSALANALSAASGVDITRFPMTPEYIWKTREEGGVQP